MLAVAYVVGFISAIAGVRHIVLGWYYNQPEEATLEQYHVIRGLLWLILFMLSCILGFIASH